MQLLVRKINRAKWDQNNICEGESPSGDAITIDLRTKNNTLSIWEINSEDEIEDAVLALTVAGDTLNTIDIVIFNADQLRTEDLNVENSKGHTIYTGFADRHRDLTELDYKSLGTFARIIIDSLKCKNVKRFTVSKLKGILKNGLDANKISIESLNEGLRKKLKLQLI